MSFVSVRYVVDFRNEIVVGNGGRQILAEDPLGNLVELLEQSARNAEGT